MSIFTPNISYDLLLVIDQVFQILRFFTVLNVVYDPFFLHHKNHYFRKEFLDKTIFFTLFVLSCASDNTTSLNIGEDQCMVRPPPQILEGTVPPVPLRSPPLVDLTPLTQRRCMDRDKVISISGSR